MMDEGEADLAVVLTEGAIKSICDGLPLRILQSYVQTPLQWGIHVGGESHYNDITQLENKKAAISRYGSGSHLMAFVLAQKKGWDPKKLNFEVVHTMEGAVEALREGRADFFMWEHFTTKPLVMQGRFKRMGDCPTPWPCFVIAATRSVLENERGVLSHILEVINLYTSEFKRIPSIDRTLANRYGLPLDDVQNWLGMTRWSQGQIQAEIIDYVQDTLLDLNLISNKIRSEQILTNL